MGEDREDLIPLHEIRNDLPLLLLVGAFRTSRVIFAALNPPALEWGQSNRINVLGYFHIAGVSPE